MISVEDACKIATEGTNIPYIRHITEIDDVFVMPMVNKDGYAMSDGARTVNKMTGELSTFIRSKDSITNLRKNGKEIAVPNKYCYPGEIKY